MAHISYVKAVIVQESEGETDGLLTVPPDRLSTHGWDGQSLVVTLARTSSPTQPIAGPTKSPPCMFNQGHYASSSPRRLAGNLSMPAYPPLSPGYVAVSVQWTRPFYTICFY